MDDQARCAPPALAARGRRELQPFHARSFFSANPDVSFTAMNSDEPLKTSPYHEDGRLERLELIRQRLPGVDEVITRVPPEGAGLVHLMQAGGPAVHRSPRRRPCDQPHAARSHVGRERHAHGNRPLTSGRCRGAPRASRSEMVRSDVRDDQAMSSSKDKPGIDVRDGRCRQGTAGMLVRERRRCRQWRTPPAASTIVGAGSTSGPIVGAGAGSTEARRSAPAARTAC